MIAAAARLGEALCAALHALDAPGRSFAQVDASLAALDAAAKAAPAGAPLGDAALRRLRSSLETAPNPRQARLRLEVAHTVCTNALPRSLQLAAAPGIAAALAALLCRWPGEECVVAAAAAVLGELLSVDADRSSPAPAVFAAALLAAPSDAAGALLAAAGGAAPPARRAAQRAALAALSSLLLRAATSGAPPADGGAFGAAAGASAGRRPALVAALGSSEVEACENAPLYARPEFATEGAADEWDPASALRSYAAAAAQHPRLYSLTLTHQLRQAREAAGGGGGGGGAAGGAEHAEYPAGGEQQAASFWDEII
ncbi:MAG: hypothetical protein J3K34DRAFT_527377 [Monoraphidium minutum]|nr:MAG: hypothetical protein J3K34DRAFT_527377 [Monoraphidium minutum]